MKTHTLQLIHHIQILSFYNRFPHHTSSSLCLHSHAKAYCLIMSHAIIRIKLISKLPGDHLIICLATAYYLLVLDPTKVTSFSSIHSLAPNSFCDVVLHLMLFTRNPSLFSECLQLGHEVKLVLCIQYFHKAFKSFSFCL